MLSTDPKNDYVELQLQRTKNDFPKATKAQIEKLRPKAVQQANKNFAGDPFGYEADGGIYLPFDTLIFNPMALKNCQLRRYNILGVGVLGHERYNTSNGTDP